jgi:hypothetical protein
MGGKDSRANEMDRPESGGADKDMEREKTGLLERDKQKFAMEEAEKRGNAPEQHSEQHAPFAVGTPPNNDPRK